MREAKFVTYDIDQEGDVIKVTKEIPENRALSGFSLGQPGCLMGGACIFDGNDLYDLPVNRNALMLWCSADKELPPFIPDGGSPLDSTCIENLEIRDFSYTYENYRDFAFNYSSSIARPATVIFYDKDGVKKYQTNINFSIGENLFLTVSSQIELPLGENFIVFEFNNSECNIGFPIIRGHAIENPDPPQEEFCNSEIVDTFKDETNGHFMVAKTYQDSTGNNVIAEYIDDFTYQVLEEYDTIKTKIPFVQFVRRDEQGDYYVVGLNNTEDSTIIEKHHPRGVIIFSNKLPNFTATKFYILYVNNELTIFGKRITDERIVEYTMELNGSNITLNYIADICYPKGVTQCEYVSKTKNNFSITKKVRNQYNIYRFESSSSLDSFLLDSMVRIKYIESLEQDQFIMAGEFTGVYVNDTTYIPSDSAGTVFIIYWLDLEMQILKTKIIRKPYRHFKYFKLGTDFFSKLVFAYFDEPSDTTTITNESCKYINGVSLEFIEAKKSLESLNTGNYLKVNEDEMETLTVHPNPFKKDINLVIESKMVEFAKVMVVDLKGNTVFEDDIVPLQIGENIYIISEDKFSSGIYKVLVNIGDAPILVKTIVKVDY